MTERLIENVKLNQLANVTVNHAAVCDQLGSIELRLQNDDSEGNSLVSFRANWPSVQVPAVTIDGYLASNGIARVDVLKIDVEGAEAMVIKGAEKLLTSLAPPLLIIESNPITLKAAGCSPERLRAQIAEFGYRCYGIEKLTSDQDPVWNILAVHSTTPCFDLYKSGGVESLIPL